MDRGAWRATNTVNTRIRVRVRVQLTGHKPVQPREKGVGSQEGATSREWEDRGSAHVRPLLSARSPLRGVGRKE